MNVESSINRVIEALERRWGVDALWLFGSRASGVARPDSDLDLAALFHGRPAADELFGIRGELEQLAGMPVDVVDLERASPILAMQVLRSGKLLIDAVPSRRTNFVAQVPGRYEDLKRVRAPIERELLKRVSHG